MGSIYFHEPSGLKKLNRSCTLKHGFLVAEKVPLVSLVSLVRSPLLAKFILKHTIFLFQALDSMANRLLEVLNVFLAHC